MVPQMCTVYPRHLCLFLSMQVIWMKINSVVYMGVCLYVSVCVGVNVRVLLSLGINVQFVNSTI